MGLEFELKFAAGEESFQRLKAQFGPFSVLEMETTYYDTADGGLSARHITLRRRMENGRSVCTVKTPKGGNTRGEWEMEWDDILTAIPELCKLGAPEELLFLTQNGVEPVCGARFTRLFAPIELKNATLELALDKGILLAGEKTQPLQEVEVELKSGDAAQCTQYARALAAQFGLTPEPDSKYRRARRLRGE